MDKISTDFNVGKDGRVVLNNGLRLNMNPEDYMYMQLLQSYVVEIMLVVDRFCKDNNITYYLGEGSLLGAVRHNGFIPWDDDVDLLMPRADYEKFLQLAKNGLPEGYALDSTETNPHHWTVLSHVQMTRKVPYVKDRLRGIALNIGPNVDIFPLDSVPDDRSKELAKRGNKVRILRRTLWIKSGLHQRSWYRTAKRRLQYYYPLKLYGKFRSYKSLHSEINRIMTCTNNLECDYYCNFASLYYSRREAFRKTDFGTPKYVDFAGHQFPIPEHPKRILRRIYGDYKQMPSVNSRKSKHFFNFDATLLKNSEDSKIFEEIRKTAKRLAVACPETDTEDLSKKNEDNIFTAFALHFKEKLRRLYLRHAWHKRCERYGKYSQEPILDKVVFYDSFSGLGILDSPRTIFKRLLERKEFSDYTHVWTIDDPKISKLNIDEFSSLPNIKLIRRNSKEYIYYLATAKYIICNSSVPQYFSRRKEQMYLNTWHGVPSKVMGYERPGQRVNATKNIMHNFLNSTHIIGANHFTAERMFKKAYMLSGAYEGKLLDEPLPRTDTVHTTTREAAMAQLKRAGIVTNKKIVIYAPTWKGSLYNALNYDLTELKAAVKTLRENINTDEYEIFLRVHYFIYRAVSMDSEMSKICIPFTVDTDELLSVVSVLISDYSSIFFDFLGTGNPILFYVPDIEDYSENRGLYIPMEDMPGPVSTSLKDIAGYINNIESVKVEYREKYRKMAEWCCSKEDGKVADRVIDSVFLGKTDAVIPCATDKKKLLFMADWRKPFNHCSSLIKLFKRIDYDKYDVTLLTDNSKNDFRNELLEKINPNVRILINDKRINTKFADVHRIYNAIRNGEISIEEACRKLPMESEWQRITGGIKFDELCLVQPNSSPIHWLLLSYFAPIEQKTLITQETVLESVYENPNYKKHFNAVLKQLSTYEKKNLIN